eukprot:ctg_1159.g406
MAKLARCWSRRGDERKMALVETGNSTVTSPKESTHASNGGERAPCSPPPRTPCSDWRRHTPVPAPLSSSPYYDSGAPAIDGLYSTSADPRSLVGVMAIEVYFPQQAVRQAELERYDQAPPGKYTVGLGQEAMAFCGDREDVRSMCMTVVQTLMEKHRVDYNDIGRLEVGTETILDKAKSVKTSLMTLFEQSGNFEVEGIDSNNACYAGTNALFNTIAWCESASLHDGRFGLVVCGDIAVYPSGAARATGGAGAVALLVGRADPGRYPHLRPVLVLEPGLKSSHCENTWDFFKPIMREDTEYPIVHGDETIGCYMRALDICYAKFSGRVERQAREALRPCLQRLAVRDVEAVLTERMRCAVLEGTEMGEAEWHAMVTDTTAVDGEPMRQVLQRWRYWTRVDYTVFHAPFNKLVRKSFARLVLNDVLRLARGDMSSDTLRTMPSALKRILSHGQQHPASAVERESHRVPALSPTLLRDKPLTQALLQWCAPLYDRKCAPSAELARQIGNAYTASLFGNLLCLLCRERDALIGRRIVMFGFGSGMAASMYSLRVMGSPDAIVQPVRLFERLAARTFVSPAAFHRTLALRERAHGACDYEPQDAVEQLERGTYYLRRIGTDGIRYYARVESIAGA